MRKLLSSLGENSFHPSPSQITPLKQKYYSIQMYHTKWINLTSTWAHLPVFHSITHRITSKLYKISRVCSHLLAKWPDAKIIKEFKIWLRIFFLECSRYFCRMGQYMYYIMVTFQSPICNTSQYEIWLFSSLNFSQTNTRTDRKQCVRANCAWAQVG